MFISVRKYLDRLAFSIRLPNGKLAQVSNKELIAKWSQQIGAAHQDSHLDLDLATSQNLGLNIGGRPANDQALGAITRTILWVSETYLKKIKSKIKT